MSEAAGQSSAKRTTGMSPGKLVSQIRSSPIAGLIIGLAAAFAILIVMLLWLRSPDYAVLYSGLTDQSGGEVVAELKQMQIDYRLSGGGSQILVPQNKVSETRLALADQGLPKQGDVGLELMDTQPFGASEFSEQINFQRGLQGELQRSIETIREVRTARVQLALPKDSVFVKEQDDPKASVVLSLARGRELSQSQVTAIQHLVASAVPGLQDAAVSIVNAQGRLLTDDGQSDLGGANESRLNYVRRIESRYETRIAELIAPMVGADNMRVTVSANINFDQRETTSETFTPNDGGEASAVRSRELNSEHRSSGGGAGGVPGALSNQPTPDQPSPINNQDDNPDDGGGDNAGNGGQDQGGDQNGDDLQSSGAQGLADDGTISSQTVVNYEVSQVVERVEASAGGVVGLSAAVMLNQSIVQTIDDGDEDGDAAGDKTPATRQGLTEEQIAEIRRLVSAVLSAGDARSSQVEIVQAPFVADSSQADEAMDTPPFYLRGDVQALAIKALQYGAFLLVALYLWRRMVKPQLERTGLLQPSKTKPKAATATETVSDNDDKPQAASDSVATRQDAADLRQEAQAYADRDPHRVASLLKGWMNDDT